MNTFEINTLKNSTALKEMHDKYLASGIEIFDVNSGDDLLICCKLYYIFMLAGDYNNAFEMFKIFDPLIFESDYRLYNFFFTYPDRLFHDEHLYFYSLCLPTRSNCTECNYFSRCYHQPELTEFEIASLNSSFTLQSNVKHNNIVTIKLERK